VSGPDGEKLERNPFKDRRVREALSAGIDRKAIVERVMEGAAVPSGQFLPPGRVGYVPDLPPPACDPERARRLLAEAGYPRGFRLTLSGPNDRYVNDGEIIQAVGQMWSRIGVATAVESMGWPTYVARAGRLEFAAFLFGLGSGSGEASDPLRSLVATYDVARGRGAVNRGRYSNPALDAMIEQAVTIADDSKREAALQEATRMAMRDVAFIPLYNQMNIWGLAPGLAYTPRVDEATRTQDVRPVP
jgi:peptide/nickel transport system substrate-binding protein